MAALPIVVLLGSLGLFRTGAPKAAAAGLLAALVVAIWPFRMPAGMALAAAGYGACFGLFPIGWIVFAAVFLYTLTVEAGQFEVIKSSIAGLSADRRIQALLIAFNFGAFLEGCAGFGAPVAISSALMIGVGFPPLYAAGLALLANTAPVAFGSLGIPIITLGKVTGISPEVISIMAGRQLPFFSLLIPAWMVVAMSGWRGLREVWPAVLVAGGSFAAVQFAVSQLFGPMLVDVAGGLVSLIAMALFLRVWKPRTNWRFADEPAETPDPVAAYEQESSNSARPHHIGRPGLRSPNYRRGEIARAWVPWALLSVFVFLWGLTPVRTFLEGGLSAAANAEREKKAAAEGALRAAPLLGTAECFGRLDGAKLRDRPAAQPSPAITASRRQRRRAGEGGVQFQLADGDGDKRSVGVRSVGSVAWHFPQTICANVMADFARACMAAVHDCRDAGNRLRNAL